MNLYTMAVTSLFVCLALAWQATASSPLMISSTFTDESFRIARQLVADRDARALLQRLVHDGVPQGGTDETFTPESVKAMGDAGERSDDQPAVADYAGALQNYLSDEDRPDSLSSLIYYMEQLDGPALRRSDAMIGEVATNSVLEDGGTIHLYLSAPGASALGNHTDTTDIVVLQLDGAKEWFLCAKPEEVKEQHSPEEFELFSKKLSSCSSYSAPEIDHNLDCERTILYPGDALFLPRRTVHSARALSDQFSAHLTFGFNEDEFCRAYGTNKQKSIAARNSRFLRRLSSSSSSSSSSSDSSSDSNSSSDDCDSSDSGNCRRVCDRSCDRKCDGTCDKSCNNDCDSLIFFSCDSSCDFSCDTDCDDECDAGCSCECY